MNSRIAQLAARLEALSRATPAEADVLQITRCGLGLAIPLPAGVVQALALREGDPLDIRTGVAGTLTVTLGRPGALHTANPAGDYQGRSSSTSSSSGSSRVSR